MRVATGSFVPVILISILYGQWEPDRRLTFFDTVFSITSYNNAWCVASSGSFVHDVIDNLKRGVIIQLLRGLLGGRK